MISFPEVIRLAQARADEEHLPVHVLRAATDGGYTHTLHMSEGWKPIATFYPQVPPPTPPDTLFEEMFREDLHLSADMLAITAMELHQELTKCREELAEAVATLEQNENLQEEYDGLKKHLEGLQEYLDSEGNELRFDRLTVYCYESVELRRKMDGVDV